MLDHIVTIPDPALSVLQSSSSSTMEGLAEEAYRSANALFVVRLTHALLS
jgi:hypothetical protein